MKKVLLMAAAAVFMSTAVEAQDVMKQTGGEKNLEVQFTPLGANPIGINGIRYRSFTSASSAWRANVFLGFNSSNDKSNGTNDEGDAVELNDKMSEFTISVAPGLEKHFPGTDRLSPYVGAEVLLSFTSTKEETDMSEMAEEVTTITTTGGSFTGGLNGVAGVDFYFAHNIYLGAELGFGLAFTTDFEETTESSADGVDDVTTPGGNAFNLGPNVQGAIRAGFLF